MRHIWYRFQKFRKITTSSTYVLFSFIKNSTFYVRLWEFWLKWAELPCLASSVSLIFRRFNWTAWSPQTFDWSRTFPLYQPIKVGCTVFATFSFYSLEVNPSEYGSYSLHYIRMYRFIANTIYSHHSFHIRFRYAQNSKTNIRFVAKQKHFLISANFCFKIFVLKQYSQNFKRISHSSAYSLANIRILVNFRYLLLQICNKGKPFKILGLN
jgi:hypothetical protein